MNGSVLEAKLHDIKDKLQKDKKGDRRIHSYIEPKYDRKQDLNF